MSFKGQVIGRVGRDPEIKTVGQNQVMNINLAVNYGRKDASGTRPTQWIDAAMWGERAAKVQPYLTKGSQHAFYLEDVHVETYVKGDGSTGVKLAAVVQDIVLLSSRSDSDKPAEKPAKGAAGSGFDNMDDDIPFISCSMQYDMTTSKARKMSGYDY